MLESISLREWMSQILSNHVNYKISSTCNDIYPQPTKMSSPLPPSPRLTFARRGESPLVGEGSDASTALDRSKGRSLFPPSRQQGLFREGGGGGTGGDRENCMVWLPDGYSQIFRMYVFGPSGFWTMAPLRYAAKFDPFLSLDCAPPPSTQVQS